MQTDHIEYRIQRANETYQDAVFLFEKGSLNSCINRLYYAAFYATLALLLVKGIEVKSHNGVKQKLGEEFVLKGEVPKKNAKVFSILSDYRHKGDYDDLYDFSKEVIQDLLIPTREYIDLLADLARKQTS